MILYGVAQLYITAQKLNVN